MKSHDHPHQEMTRDMKTEKDVKKTFKLARKVRSLRFFSERCCMIGQMRVSDQIKSNQHHTRQEVANRLKTGKHNGENHLQLYLYI